MNLKEGGAKGPCGDYPFQSGSDCEVILALYRKHGRDLVQHLSGMYAFVLFDPRDASWIIARDPIGIIPLYHGTDEHGRIWVASEMKALMDTCDDVRVFPPGRVWTSSEAEPAAFYQRDWMEGELPDHPYRPEELNEALTSAVRSHLMGDDGRREFPDAGPVRPPMLLASGGVEHTFPVGIEGRVPVQQGGDGAHGGKVVNRKGFNGFLTKGLRQPFPGVVGL